jgi:hypothetical protein
MISSGNQEAISQCFLKAIAASADVATNFHPQDINSEDGVLSKRVTLQNGSSIDVSVSFQLKTVFSSTNYHYDENHNLIYNLKAKNYQDLILNATHPRMLAVLVLPSNEEDWVRVSIEELVMKQRMYWVCLTGYPPTTNPESISVKLPADHILNSTELLRIMQMAGENGSLS